MPQQTNLEPRVSALETKVTALTTRVAAVETTLAQNAAADAALAARVTALEIAIEGNPPPPPPPPPPSSTVDARTFAGGTHAGTAADPWPGSAIKAAIDSLNGAVGTISVADGVWKFDVPVTVNKSNWTLQGATRDGAILRFENTGQLWVNVGDRVKFDRLTFDCSHLPVNNPAAGLRVSAATNSSMTGCKVLGHQNGGMPGTFWEGGNDNSIIGNDFHGEPFGGDNCCQLQPLGGTLDARWTVSNNSFSCVNLVVIGLSDVQIKSNTFTNGPMGNMVAIQVCGAWDKTVTNVAVDGNTLDIGASNGVAITGLPNDPGGMSVIDGFTITNNIIKGTFAAIHCQSFDSNNYLDNTLLGNEKRNVVISGNTLHSYWGAAGIDLRGGAGRVDTVLVENNTLTNSVGAANAIGRDANTLNVTVRGNTGVPNV